MSEANNWAIDSIIPELNPPVNLKFVETFDMGTVEHSIQFRLQNNTPVKWMFSSAAQMNTAYQELLKQIVL